MSLPEIKVTGRVLTLSKSTLARNRELLGAGTAARPAGEAALKNPAGGAQASVAVSVPVHSSRIRQSGKPKLNQNEREALAWLKCDFGSAYTFHPHALRVELANGCTYEPDIIGQPISAYNPDFRLVAWEVKGDWMLDDAVVKLKVAARAWPSIHFRLIWNDGHQWKIQKVVP